MKHLVISTSHNPNSNSLKMAHEAFKQLDPNQCEFINLQDYKLPHCDGGTAFADENVSMLKQKIESCIGVLLAIPIYNYNIGSTVKNLIELTGQSWTGKVVGMMFAAGGSRSYLAGLPIINSLMMDFRCVAIPRFVFATGDAFDTQSIKDIDVKTRIKALTTDLTVFSTALEYARENLTPAKHV